MSKQNKFTLVRTYATKQSAKQSVPNAKQIVKHGDGRYYVKQTEVKQ